MENLEICRECEGSCCKEMGCHYSPDDFKDLSFESLKKEIDKGYISIDWWEGNPFDDNREINKAYYLRIKNVGANIVDPSWGGECILLTNDGCKLSYNKRPKGGRMLIPDAYGPCESKYSKQEAARDWYKYRDILSKLVKHYKEVEKENFKDCNNLNLESLGVSRNNDFDIFKALFGGMLTNAIEDIHVKNNNESSELEVNFKENQSKEDTELIKDFLYELAKWLE